MKINKKKIGILGGTFDPPHIGHIYISKIALKKFHLNFLMWIITKQNPLKKKPFFKTEARIKLSKNITEKEKKIFIRYLDKKVKSKAITHYNVIDSTNNYSLLKLNPETGKPF